MPWMFRRRRDEHEELVARLKAERPRADEEFVDLVAERVRRHGRFRGLPVRVALAATSATVVLVAVALVGGTGQYTTALGAVADLASATATSSHKDDKEKSKKDSASKEYSEERKECKKAADTKSEKKECKDLFPK